MRSACPPAHSAACRAHHDSLPTPQRCAEVDELEEYLAMPLEDTDIVLLDWWLTLPLTLTLLTLRGGKTQAAFGVTPSKKKIGETLFQT